MTNHDPLTMWTIYHFPTTGQYVVKRWLVTSAPEPVLTSDVHTADSLEAIRRKIPQGLYCQPRYEHDDPSIVETWF
jgi:hypothetical protein